MTERIDVLSHRPGSTLLLEAMATLLEQQGNMGDLLPFFHMEPGSAVEVKVTVNGIEVPFMAAVDAGIQRILDQHEEAVKNTAVRLITESKLAGLHAAIEEAGWKISDSLQEVLNEKKEPKKAPGSQPRWPSNDALKIYTWVEDDGYRISNMDVNDVDSGKIRYDTLLANSIYVSVDVKGQKLSPSIEVGIARNVLANGGASVIMR